MNCISRSLLLICLIACGACGVPASGTDTKRASSGYAVHYTISPQPSDNTVAIEMTVSQTNGQLREMSFSLTDSSVSGLQTDGQLLIEDDTAYWRPNKDGGRLTWLSEVRHQRGDGGYDAWLSPDWGIFRAEDIIPRARTRTLKGASSETSMSFDLPHKWTVVSEYSTLTDNIEVSHPDRRFAQPRGWIGVGQLGIRRETISGTRIAVAAPEGQSARRMDMLALLNWTLPELSAVLPDSIPRLTIVSAGKPMWRGGLSAPASIFIHVDRPLISENATSTLVHEIVHVAMDASAIDGFDWIVEGLAEFYSLELLQRGGAITTRRYKRALEKQVEWSKDAKQLCASESSGAATALAVVTYRDLDVELREKSGGKVSLDNVLAEISRAPGKVSLQSLQDIVTELLQEPSATLYIDNLPGCRNFLPASET